MEVVDCANCGTPRADLFCPHCGQNARVYQRAFPPMLWELLRETFDLDSRVLRTIRLLLFKPGELALEFSRNRRARYVSPIRLYLFISLAFFFILSFNAEVDADLDVPAATIDVSADEPQASQTQTLESLLSEERQQKVAEMLARESTVAQQLVQGIAQTIAEEPEPMGSFESFILGQIIDVLYEPALAFNALMDNLPVAMFFLLPVYALLLGVLYLGKRRYYVEHLVFATHLHSFAFIVYSVLLLLPDESRLSAVAAFMGYLPPALWLLLAVYHFSALKRYYGDGYVRTSFKFVAQLMLYFVVLIPLATAAVVAFTLATL